MAKDTKKTLSEKTKNGELQHPLTPFEEMDRLFDAMWPRGWMTTQRRRSRSCAAGCRWHCGWLATTWPLATTARPQSMRPTWRM